MANSDGQTYKEMIVQSTAAKRMIEMASPIYEDSYVGSWIFEILGRSWDEVWEIIDDMPNQLFPHMVTWLIDLWERRYGITPNIGDDLDTRRRRLLEAEAQPQPFTPWALDQYVYAQCGRHVVVDEHIAPYTFGVYIVDNVDALPLDYSKVRRHIIKHKHSHMSFELFSESDEKITIKSETMYWKFRYRQAGTEPYRNVLVGVERSEIEIQTEGEAHKIEYVMAGVEKTGTKPRTNTLVAIERSEINVETAGTGYKHPYQMTGTEKTGTKPKTNTIVAIERSKLTAETDSTGYRYSYPMAGTENAGVLPEVNISTGIKGKEAQISSSGKAYWIRYPPCGTMKAGGEIL